MDTTVADKLLALRKQNGLSQEELAEKLGISRQAVSKWERAEASPDTENLIALAKIYNISLDKLFEINTESVRTDRSCINLTKEKSMPAGNDGVTDKMPQGYSSSTTSDFGTRVKYPENSGRNVEEIYPQMKKKEVNQKKVEFKSDSQPNDFSKYSTYTTADTSYSSGQTNQTSQTYTTGPSSFSNLKTAGVVDQMSVMEDHQYKALMSFPYPIFLTCLYLLLGAFLHLWHPAWMMFLTIPLYYTTIEAVRKKNLNIFCFPVLVVMFYLFIGFALNLWHPGWISFMAIPLYYWIINLKK